MSKSKNKKPKNTKPISERYTLKHIIANIYLTVMFTNHGWFNLSVTTSLYVLIAGLFVLNFSINFHKIIK